MMKNIIEKNTDSTNAERFRSKQIILEHTGSIIDRMRKLKIPKTIIGIKIDFGLIFFKNTQNNNKQVRGTNIQNRGCRNSVL